MSIACSPFGGVLNHGKTGTPLGRRAMLGSMGRLVAGVAGIGLGPDLFRCATAQSPAVGGAAEAIYAGGPILTMTDARPVAEAVAVRAGRILAVGSRAEVEATRGSGTRSVDLGGHALLPGFVDPHGHVVIVGIQAVGANLLPDPDGEANDLPAIVRLLRDWGQRDESAMRRYNLILGFGYDESHLREGRRPTATSWTRSRPRCRC